MKFSNLLVGAVAVWTAGLCGISASQASLIGTSVTLDYYYQIQHSHDGFTVVEPGAEISCSGGGGGNANVCGILLAPVQTVDVGASSILYAYNGPGASFDPAIPNKFDFENLNPGFTIGNVTLSTNITGLDLSRITFTGSSLQIDMHGLGLDPTQPGSPDFFNIGLTSAVPEPSTWAMMILGFAGIGFMAYRRKRRALSAA
jgi:hypothetical protein